MNMKNNNNIISSSGNNNNAVDNNNNSNETKVKNELELYALLKSIDDFEQDSLQWWRQHSSSLPILSRVARRYLNIPATSASSERIFSSAGLLVTKKRSVINSNTVAEVTFLQSNWIIAEKWKEEKQKSIIKTSSNNNNKRKSSVISLIDDYDNDKEGDGVNNNDNDDEK